MADPVWAAPPAALALHPHDVHVWRVRLDLTPHLLSKLSAALDADEQARAARFRFDIHRTRFTAGRAILRHLLARYLEIRPDEMVFRYSAHGKPSLDGSAADSGLRFNFSNAGGMGLAAFALGREVGVDLEELVRVADFASIAERFFSPAENEALLALPPKSRDAAFFTCWTRKEAYIKAVGEGLSIPLDSFDVTLAPGDPPRLLATRGEPGGELRWSLHELHPGPGFVGALAVEAPAPAVHWFDWEPPAA
ncbi:MAG TPA: 4'-phosphopantetheinyl transferase superfamily protein [Longimicrobium sp.]